MKANELRIGNFYDCNGLLRVVSPNTIEEVWVAERSWVKPIPLTEEWLLKFGFEEEIREGNSSDFWVYHKSNLTFNSNHGWWYRNQYIDNQPKHVHTLQNLYFALTGEELTLKEL